jgi:hypothetical protein
VRDGHDLRYYENVLLYVNQGRDGISGTFLGPNVLDGRANNITLYAGHQESEHHGERVSDGRATCRGHPRAQRRRSRLAGACSCEPGHVLVRVLPRQGAEFGPLAAAVGRCSRTTAARSPGGVVREAPVRNPRSLKLIRVERHFPPDQVSR